MCGSCMHAANDGWTDKRLDELTAGIQNDNSQRLTYKKTDIYLSDKRKHPHPLLTQIPQKKHWGTKNTTSAARSHNPVATE